MNYLLLALATLASSGKALFCKLAGSARGRKVFLANFEAFSVAFLTALIFSADELPSIFNVSIFSFLLALAFGFAVAFTQLTQMKAMNKGPASLTTLIYSSGFLIPIIFSYFAWGDPISVFQIVGIVILLVSLALIVLEPSGAKINGAWILFALLATLGSGTNAILQKTHQNSAHSDEIKIFLVYSLFFSALFSLAVFLLYRPSKDGKKEKEAERKTGVLPYLFPIFLGVSVGFLNFINLKLAGVLPAAIQFPVFNVGSLILTSAVSIIAFRERLSTRKIIGYVIGIGAILMIGLL